MSAVRELLDREATVVGGVIRLVCDDHDQAMRLLRQARAEASASADMLSALEVTAGNLRSLARAKVIRTYDKWLSVIDGAIAKAEGRR